MKVVKLSMMILAFLLFISMGTVSVGAFGGGRVAIRPLSDWLVNNASNFDYYSSIYYAMIQDHSGDPMSVLPDGVVGSTEVDGYVLERVLHDGRAEITVYMHVQNAPLTVYSWEDMSSWFDRSFAPPLPEAILGDGTDGFIDYFASYKFIVPAPGQVIPNFFSTEPISIFFEGSGYGTFTDDAASFGFTPNTQGIVHITQIGLFSAASHADFNGALADTFAVELITIHQLG